MKRDRFLDTADRRPDDPGPELPPHFPRFMSILFAAAAVFMWLLLIGWWWLR